MGDESVTNGKYRFVWVTWIRNINGVMEYRVAFILQIFSMLLNNIFYFLFWQFFLGNFHQIQDFSRDDILILFSFVNISFGIISILFGNVHRIAHLVISGNIDYYLLRPKPVLLQIIIGRSNPAGIADIFFGFICYIFSDHSAFALTPLFIFLVVSVVMVMLSFEICLQSAVFWFGDISFAVSSIFYSTLTFAFYPNHLFSLGIRVLIMTVFPAAYFSVVPFSILTNPTVAAVFLQFGAAILFVLLAIAIFRAGLRKYESTSAFAIYA